jgi:catechol 2,3-dioxygenase
MQSGMTIGNPVLRIRYIDRVLTFYEKTVGLQVIKRYSAYDYDDDSDDLIYEIGLKSANSNQRLLTLHHDPNAKVASQYSAGLFHFAILVPDRKSLASTYLALRNSGVDYDGFADHLVSESLYLRDPENNGIEIYRDRSSKEWSRDGEGHIMMDTLPLDLDSLIDEINNNNQEEERNNIEAFPTGARIGHIHLKVTNLERSMKFYHEKLGLDITSDWGSMGAAFLSAGGYHHHIGMNTWNSLNGDSHIHGKTGLENFTITIPDKSTLNILGSIMQDSSKPEKQQRTEERSQLLISDPDGIQFHIKLNN